MSIPIHVEEETSTKKKALSVCDLDRVVHCL